MSHQVAFVAEGLVTCRTIVILLPRFRRMVIRIVINVLVALQQLLLSESLFAILALERFLIAVDQHMRL